MCLYLYLLRRVDYFLPDLQTRYRAIFWLIVGGAEERGHCRSGKWGKVVLFSPLFISFVTSKILIKHCVQLQSSVTEYEFCQEDYRLLQVEFWSKFYACCVQYQDVLSTPLALHVSPSTAMVCVLKKVPDLSHTSFCWSEVRECVCVGQMKSKLSLFVALVQIAFLNLNASFIDGCLIFWSAS